METTEQHNQNKHAPKMITNQNSEAKIEQYKLFYKKYLINIKNRDEILATLYAICIKYRNLSSQKHFILSEEVPKLNVYTQEFLKKYFNTEVLILFNKKIPHDSSFNKAKLNNEEDNFWLNLLSVLAGSFEEINDEIKKEINYKSNYLNFLYNSLYYFGLHQDILNRDRNIYVRYNLLVEHHFKSKKKNTEIKLLLTYNKLNSEYLLAYENKLPIKINGKLIPFKDIYAIKITSTVLMDDEIELFAIKNNFKWNDGYHDEIAFLNLCKDETDSLLKNPFLKDSIVNQEHFKNHAISFIHQSRISELKSINKRKFDLNKLIQFCDELNVASINKCYFTVSFLGRAILDHTPPIFGFKNFTEFANNYNGGKSFKKSMLNLDSSLRNIADMHIHSQIREKEVLPNITQIDFSNDMDVLLSEVYRKLK